MAQIFPAASDYTLQHSGPLAAFDLACGDHETAVIQASSSVAISSGDILRFSGIILALPAGSALSISHNNTPVAEFGEAGPFSVDYEANHASPNLRIFCGSTTDPAQRIVGLWRVEKLG